MSQVASVPSFKIIGKEVKLGSKVGAGANGEVYEARPVHKSKHFAFPPRFAVKIIRQDLCSAEFLTAVERELETGRDLKHPFIVQYIGSWVELQRGTHAGCYCLALHYCDGGDMHALIAGYIQRHEWVPNDLVTLLMAHVFSALNYSHSKKVIHRDIKPANIFLVRGTGEKRNEVVAAMVGDYGLARPLERTVQMVATRVGTPCYCSPEIVAAEPYTVKTDIFSAGAMFYELIMQERAFWRRGYNDRQTFYDILHKDPVPHLMKQCTGRVDAGILRVVSMCLAKHEKDRPTAYQVLTGICAAMQTFVLRHSIPVVEENQAPSQPAPAPAHAVPAHTPPETADKEQRGSPCAPRCKSAGAPADGTPMAVDQSQKTPAAAQRLMRRFRDVVPCAYDADVLTLLEGDVETFLLLKIVATTRAANAMSLRSGLYTLLDTMNPHAPADAIVQLMAAPALPTCT